MTDSKDRAQSIFLNALEFAAEGERLAYVDAECRGNEELLKEVDELLDHEQQLGMFMDDSDKAGNATIDMPKLQEQVGTVIGPYKLREQIGEGGMGVVYVAEQTEPVKRKVALKIIKPGMDTKEVIARFQAERQALALMNHPNIAKVLDTGATETGRPYFVMELINGIPITDYCDKAKLTTQERLDLFVKVCRAVQHAHQKGVIHRDIKPSNVLITAMEEGPEPKVIDFGVAKAINQQLTEQTIYTAHSQMVGTPLYMSPEQAERTGFDIDTRTDVYSLGVMLYELLTGTTPFNKETLKQADYDEMRRIIREDEPQRPSLRISTLKAEQLSTISNQRGHDPRKYSHSLSGELDWIVMKALEKDRTRRYESASGFAADITRFLNDEPVEACPPSVTYKFRKFARRNKAVLTTVFIVVAVLILGIIGTSWQAVRASKAEEAARSLLISEREAQEKINASRQREDNQRTQINRDLSFALAEAATLSEQAGTSLQSDPDVWTKARELTRRAETLAENPFSDPVLVEQVGSLRAELDKKQRDREMILRLTEIRMSAADFEEIKARKVALFTEYKDAFVEYGMNPETTPVEEAVQRIIRSEETIQNSLLAAIFHWRSLEGQFGNNTERSLRARKWLSTVIDKADQDPWRRKLRDVGSRNDREELLKLAASAEIAVQEPRTLIDLGSMLFDLGEQEAAINFLKRAQLRHPDDFWLNQALVDKYSQMAQNRGVKPQHSDDYLRYSSVLAALRPNSARSIIKVGAALYQKNKTDEAITAYRRAIELNPDFITSYISLGLVLKKKEKYDEAIKAFCQAIQLNPEYASAYVNLGLVLIYSGKRDEAIEAYRQAIQLDPENAGVYYNLGVALPRISHHHE